MNGKYHVLVMMVGVGVTVIVRACVTRNAGCVPGGIGVTSGLTSGVTSLTEWTLGVSGVVSVELSNTPAARALPSMRLPDNEKLKTKVISNVNTVMMPNFVI